MSETPQRRNPLRLIVSKETQLHILWLVGGSIFVAMAGVLLISMWLQDWVWTTVLALAFGVFVSLWVSRRIAGPFYRIERDLEAILSGATQNTLVQVRPGDPLQHLAELVSQLAKRAESVPSRSES